MGSMVMSTFMMFVPRHVVYLFLAICCVGFFGIYIPYNESKKRGEVWGPLRWIKGIKKVGRKKPPHPDRIPQFDHISAIGPGTQHQLEQLNTMKQAGLITQQEYEERRKKFLKEQ